MKADKLCWHLNVVNLCSQDILVYTHDINRKIQTFLALATCHRSPQTWHIWHDVAGIFHLGPPYAQCPILRGFLSHGGPQVIFQDQWPFVIEKPRVKRGVLRCFGHIQMEQNNWDVSRIWGFSAANMRFQQAQWFTLVQWLNSGCTSGLNGDYWNQWEPSQTVDFSKHRFFLIFFPKWSKLSFKLSTASGGVNDLIFVFTQRRAWSLSSDVTSQQPRS